MFSWGKAKTADSCFQSLFLDNWTMPMWSQKLPQWIDNGQKGFRQHHHWSVSSNLFSVRMRKQATKHNLLAFMKFPITSVLIQLIALVCLCLSVSVQECICARGEIRLKLVSDLLPSSSKVPTQKSVACISLSRPLQSQVLVNNWVKYPCSPHRCNASFLCRSHSSRESSSYICLLLMLLLADLNIARIANTVQVTIWNLSRCLCHSHYLKSK